MSLNLTRVVSLALTTHQRVGFASGEFFSDIGAQGFDQGIVFARDTLRTIKEQTLLRDRPSSFQKWLGATWPGANKPGVSLLVDNSWVRMFSCCWHPALKTHQQFQRYAEIEFERRFHTSLDQWLLVPDRVRPNAETLWCAYRLDHLESLKTLADEMGFRIHSLMPTLIAEISSLGPQIGALPTLYVSAGDQSNNVCWFEGGRMRDLLLVTTDICDEVAVIETLLARLNKPLVGTAAVLRLQGTRLQVMRSLVAGLALTTSTAAIDFSLETLSAQ